MEKLVTVFGTRPEIIRLSVLIPKLDKYFNHKIINTYQNLHSNLNDIFLDQLKIRKVDYNLTISHKNYGEEIGDIINKTYEILLKENPSKLLILGDTYSSLCILPATKLGIKIYHMEAGNRSGDWRMPEEKNRRIIDHLSDINLPYNENSRNNLLKENINPRKIFVTGNPIFEVLERFKNQISMSQIIPQLKLELRRYYLVTVHRNENLVNDKALTCIFQALSELARYDKVVVLAHPRLLEKINGNKFAHHDNIIIKESLGLFDFVRLQQSAKCVLTDSGTVPEECAYFKVPCVTLRDSSERPELIDMGASIISGTTNSPNILRAVKLAQTVNWDNNFETNVSDKVLRILGGVL